MATRDFTKTNTVNSATKESYSDLDILFTAHPVTKDITVKKDADAVKRSVRNILLTNNYERPFKPSLGLNLRSMLFELSITHTKVLENDIIRLIETYEPRANVKGVMVQSRGYSLNVLIDYAVGNDPSPHRLDLTLERVR